MISPKKAKFPLTHATFLGVRPGDKNHEIHPYDSFTPTTSTVHSNFYFLSQGTTPRPQLRVIVSYRHSSDARSGHQPRGFPQNVQTFPALSLIPYKMGPIKMIPADLLWWSQKLWIMFGESCSPKNLWGRSPKDLFQEALSKKDSIPIFPKDFPQIRMEAANHLEFKRNIIFLTPFLCSSRSLTRSAFSKTTTAQLHL